MGQRAPEPAVRFAVPPREAAQPGPRCSAPGTGVGWRDLRLELFLAVFLFPEKKVLGGTRPDSHPPWPGPPWAPAPVLGLGLALPSMPPSDHPLPLPPPLHQPAQTHVLSCPALYLPQAGTPGQPSAPCMSRHLPPPSHFPRRRRESIAAVYLRAPVYRGTGHRPPGEVGRTGIRPHCENEAHSLLGCTSRHGPASGAPSWGRRRDAGLWANHSRLITGVLCPESCS